MSALVILANGFEEIEAVAVIDILRRGGIDVIIAGLDERAVESARGLRVTADVRLIEVSTKPFEAVILPGGEPGTSNLEQSDIVLSIIKQQHSEKKLLAAICAAPRILDKAGLLNGTQATSYPGTRSDMVNCVYLENDVVKDGHIITSRGPGTAMAFSYKILETLKSNELSSELCRSMVYN